MSDGMKPLGDALSALFTNLQQRVEQVETLTEQVRNALDGPEKEHVLSAVYREDTLVVSVDSAAWCAHVRYAQQSLLERLKPPVEANITKVRVRVAAGTTASPSAQP